MMKSDLILLENRGGISMMKVLVVLELSNGVVIKQSMVLWMN